MKVLASLMLAAGLVGCSIPYTGIHRANMVTHGRIVKIYPLPAPVDAYGRTGRYTYQYNINLANGETLQIVTDPDPTAVVTDCVEVGYIGNQVTSLAVIDPQVCADIPVPNYRAQPLFR